MSVDLCAKVLGVPVHGAPVRRWNDVVVDAIEQGERIVLPHQNLHGVYVYPRSEGMRALHDEWEPYIDGMSLVFVGRLLGHRLRREHRVTLVDWLPVLLRMAASKGWRVYYLGSHPEVAARGAELLRQRFPGLQLEVDHGYFDIGNGAESRARLDRINRWAPQILFVGMGMPRQEEWTATHLDALTANVTIMAGAALDYFAGAKQTPPRWLGRIGLEWLYRLLSEPRRLAKRYLFEPWFLLGRALGDVLGRTKRRLSAADLEPCGWRADAHITPLPSRRDVLGEGSGLGTPIGRDHE